MTRVPDFSSLVFGLGNERAPLLTLFNERHVRKGDKGDTMGESTTVHDLFASSRAPRFDRARRAAVFPRTLRRDHACRKPFPCETLNSIPISLSSLRYLSRLSPQAPSHRWQAEALAQEAQVSTSPERIRVGTGRWGPVSGPPHLPARFILVFRVREKSR